jgi:hypothetical protein
MDRFHATLLVERLFARAGLTVHRAAPYSRDGLCSVHNSSALRDPRFLRAYARGVQAAGYDYRWEWRVHMALWVAEAAVKLPGDFVECGVARGFLSSAVMTYVDWGALDKTYYLLDTFDGLDPRYVTEDERRQGRLERSNQYHTPVDEVRRNFSEWPRVEIVVGPVPETLGAIRSEQIAYLHLDMNCAPPEVAALHCLWPRLVPGAIVLLDDYANRGFESQQQAMDEAVQRYGVHVCSLPTGQGMILKR